MLETIERCKQISSDSNENYYEKNHLFTNYMCVVYMYSLDLALNNLQGLICREHNQITDLIIIIIIIIIIIMSSHQ